MQYLEQINFSCKNENIIDNIIGDNGCKAIFKNAKHLKNLEELNLYSIGK